MNLIELEKKHGIKYRNSFDCGEKELNDYLQKLAKQNSNQDISQTHVLFDDEQKRIISYYSTCSFSICRESIADKMPFPIKQIPAVLIGRLAVDNLDKSKGYGKLTLVEALVQIRKISKQLIGIKVVVVDTLNDGVRDYYKKFGFQEFDSDPRRLFIPMKSIDSL